MKKWISIVMLLVLAMIVCPSTGCTSRDVAIGSGNSLIQMTNEGIAYIDSEIVGTDQQLTAVGQKLLKLEQVLTPAMKWLEYQKTVSKPGYWKINVTSEGLDRFKNDQYQVTTLEFLSLQGQFSSAIKVTDLTTGTTYDWKTLQDDLTLLKDNFEQRRKAKIEARNLSISTIKNVLKYFNEWKIQQLDDITYAISGIGLGWAEKLTTGSWTYYKVNGQLVPRGMEGDNLKAILSAR